MKHLLKSKINQRLFKSTINIIKTAFLLLLLINPNLINFTNASYQDTETSTSNTFTASCWAPPSVPVLNTPADNTYAGLGSPWETNPVMDWHDSTDYCNNGPLLYQYESYRDENLTQLAYRSSWLSNSHIPAPGTPEGTYYWRVKTKDQAGRESDFSGAWKLVVDRTAPPTPLLISPGNNISLNSIGLIQTWQQVFDNLNGEVYYDYQSYDDPALTSLRWSATYNNSSHGNGLIITKNAAGAPNGHVYWRIRSRDESGNTSAWTNPWHFLIDNSLSSPIYSGPSIISTVVLNEILPDPIGLDSGVMPDGEWVELYNTGLFSVDVNNWYIEDLSGNSAPITSSKTNTGNTIITPSGFLVIYLGPTSVTLNNPGDTISLYAGPIAPANLVDFHAYGSTPEGKSIARIPDGTGPWYDPIPTPGSANKLMDDSLDTMLDLYSFSPYLYGFSITGGGLSLFETADYKLTYTFEGINQIIAGTIQIEGDNPINVNNILLRTCSSDDTCLYHYGVKQVDIEVVLRGIIDRTLTDQITL